MGICFSKRESVFQPGLYDGTTDDGYLTLPKRRSRNYSLTRRQLQATRTNQAYRHSTEVDHDQTVVKRPPTSARLSENACVSRDTKIQQMVEVFQTCIEEAVKVIDILPHLHAHIDDEEAIQSRHSQREMVRCLIDALKASREPGRWQAFMDALDTGGYPYLVRLLNGHTEKDQSTRRKLLKLHRPELIRNLDIDSCLDKLYQRHVLHEQDMQEVKCERERRGEVAACLVLLDLVPRRSENWFEEFVAFLEASGLGAMTETLDIGNIYVEPPTRCVSQAAAASDTSQLNSDLYASVSKQLPPPEYESDERTEKIKKNDDKIRRLSLIKVQKEKQLEQKTTLTELRLSIKDLDEKIDMCTSDDSSVELEVSSDKGSCCKMDQEAINTSSRHASPPTCPKLYTQDINTSSRQDSPPTRPKFYTQSTESSLAEFSHGSNISETHDEHGQHSEMNDLKAIVEGLQTDISIIKDVVNATRSDLTAHCESVEEKLRRLSEGLQPPTPHNIHPTDSAFSDCSILSTSL